MASSKEKEKSLTLVGDVPPPADLVELTADYCGAGLAAQPDEYDRAQLKILQALSPALDPNDAFYNPEANQGDYFIAGGFARPRVQAIFVGGVKVWIEWGANRGGFVARYLERPAEAEQVDKGGWRSAWVTPNGNDVVETKEMYGLFDDVPAMFSCTSSFLQFARTMQSQFAAYPHPAKPGELMPAFARRYLLETFQKVGPKGKWYMPVMRSSEWVTREQCARALAFYKVVTGANAS
jgi:hypothetical protein